MCVCACVCGKERNLVDSLRISYFPAQTNTSYEWNVCACMHTVYMCVLTCPDFAEGRLSQQHLNTRITITVTVTASIRTTATNPPMITAVLSVSEYLSIVSVAIFSALTSDAGLVIVINTAMNIKLGILCIYSYTSREGDGLTISCSSCITSSDCDSIDSGALQLVYGVASASETATGALSSSVSLSPHHL